MSEQGQDGVAQSGSVTIFEMAPRDGLQNEAQAIPTGDKIRLVDQLTECGFSKLSLIHI